MAQTAIKLRDFIKIPSALFYASGLKAFKWDSNARMTKKEIFHLTLLLVNLGINFPAKANYIFSGELDNSLNITAYTLFLVFVLNSIFKRVFVFLGRRELSVFFKKMLATFPDTAEQRVAYKVKSYYWTIHRYNKYLMLFHMATTTLFNIFALLQSVFEYWFGLGEGDEKGKEFQYRFPYLMKFPFDVKRPIPYAVTYTLHCMGGYTCSCFTLGSDLLLITSVHLINMHFEYLARKIREYKPKGTRADIDTLIGFITYHKELLRLSEGIDNIFSMSILLNYITSCLIMCLIGFQIVAGTEILNLVKFFLFLISTLVHVFYVSMFSTKMMALSSEIGDAFYQNPWYEANTDYQRLLPLCISRAQKPVCLTAFKFCNITMQTFKSVMSTSYQFFTMINTSLSENSGKTF